MPLGDPDFQIRYLVTAANGSLPDAVLIQYAIDRLRRDRLLVVRVDSTGNGHRVTIKGFLQKISYYLHEDLLSLVLGLERIYIENWSGVRAHIDCQVTIQAVRVTLKVHHDIIARNRRDRQWRERFFDNMSCDKSSAQCLYFLSIGRIIVACINPSMGWETGVHVMETLESLLPPFQDLSPSTQTPGLSSFPAQCIRRPGHDLSSADSDDGLTVVHIKGSDKSSSGIIINDTVLTGIKTTCPELQVTFDADQAILEIIGRDAAVETATKNMCTKSNRHIQLTNTPAMMTSETEAQNRSRQTIGMKAPKSHHSLQEQETTVPITEAQPWQLDFLSLAQGKGHLPEGLQQTLTVNSDRRTGHIRAPQRTVDKTVAALWKYLASLSHQKIPLTAASSQILQTSDSRQRVQRELDAEGVVCDWHLEPGHLVISANCQCFHKAKGILMAELDREATQHGHQPPIVHDKSQLLQTVPLSPSPPALEEDREETSPCAALQTENSAPPSLAVPHRADRSAAMSPHCRTPTNKRCASALPSRENKRFCCGVTQPQTQQAVGAAEAQERELNDFSSADTEHEGQQDSSQPLDIPVATITATASNKSSNTLSNSNSNSLSSISSNILSDSSSNSNNNKRLNNTTTSRNNNNNLNNRSSSSDSLSNNSHDNISGTNPQHQASSDILGVRLDQLERRLSQVDTLARLTHLEHRVSQMERERAQVLTVHTETPSVTIQQQLREIMHQLNDIRRQQNSANSVITGVCNPSDTDSLASASSVAE